MESSGRMWGDDMLMGEFHHNIDDKARLVVPSKFRYELGETFVITRGLENCLFVYSLNDWNKIVDKLKTLPFTKKDARTFLRFFLSGATECSFDKQGRIQVPQPLASYAQLKKECVIIGVNDRLEVWSEELYDNFFNENEPKMSEMAESLFESMVE